MNVKIYVEGGGNTSNLKTRCRLGFSEFFRKAGLEGHMPRIIASGARQNAFDDFRTALNNSCHDDFIVLLVDSEDVVRPGIETWAHLHTLDGWDSPPGATEDNVHLMVVCMESWFLADLDTLANFFGQRFNRNVFPARIDVENIPLCDIEGNLEKATRQCKKGRYDKGRHSFDILAQIRPNRVTEASPHARRLVDTLIRNSIGGSA